MISGLPQVERLTTADSAGGLQLSIEAGWNQTETDWVYLLTQGQGFGVLADGRLVATSLALPYPPAFGWISMVLVTQSFRRQGLATLLLQAAADHLLAQELTPMLDATSAGQAVYSQMGFVEVERIDRWQRTGREADDSQMGNRGSIDDCLSLDLQAFGASRVHLLKDLCERTGSLVSATTSGYAIRRRGRTASQIGPVVAHTEEAGRALIDQVLVGTKEAVILDVPSRARVIREALEGHGFTMQRQFCRMALGDGRRSGDSALVQAIAGPELG